MASDKFNINFKSLPLASHGKLFNDYYPNSSPDVPSTTNALLQLSHQVDSVKEAADNRVTVLSQLATLLSKSSSNQPASAQPAAPPHDSGSSGSLSSAPTSKTSSSGGLGSAIGGASNRKGGVDPNMVAATLAQVQQAQQQAQHQASPRPPSPPSTATARQTSPPSNLSTSSSSQLTAATKHAPQGKIKVKEERPSKGLYCRNHVAKRGVLLSSLG